MNICKPDFNGFNRNVNTPDDFQKTEGIEKIINER